MLQSERLNRRATICSPSRDREPQMDLLNMDFYGEWLCGKCETLIAPNSEISIETTVFNQDGKDWIYHMAVHPACLN